MPGVRPFVFFELHDSVLEKLHLDFDEQTAVLEVKFVQLYFQKLVERFEVWSARAHIIVKRVAETRISGHLSTGALIIDGGFFDENEREGNFTIEGESLSAKSFFLETLYYEIRLNCEEVRLEKIELIGRQEDWIGPLRSPTEGGR